METHKKEINGEQMKFVERKIQLLQKKVLFLQYQAYNLLAFSKYNSEAQQRKARAGRTIGGGRRAKTDTNECF